MAKKDSGAKRAEKARKRNQKKKNNNKKGRPVAALGAKTFPDAMTNQQRRDAANTLFDHAMNCESFNVAKGLLEKAVDIDPGHIDSWVVLAEESTDIAEAKQMLQIAIKHGRKELRDDLENSRGVFWGLHHTRPFMRAKSALANFHRGEGDLDAAVEIMKEMLELNECDNQGMRWDLLEVYLRQDRVDDAENLASQFAKETTAFVSFTRLLIEFRKQGDSDELREDLKAQAERNPYIVPRLLNIGLISPISPPMFGLGSEEEADLYCQRFLFAWKSAPGAISWLRSAAARMDLDVVPNADDTEDEFDIKKEIQRQRNRIKKLPQVQETWYADVAEGEGDSEIGAFWFLTVMEADTEEPVFMEPGEEEYVTPDGLLYGFFDAMLTPEAGEPRRPERILMFDEALCKKLCKRLERLDIKLEMADSRPEIFDVLSSGTASLMGQAAVDLEDLKPLPRLVGSWVVDWKQLPILVPDEVGLSTNPNVILVLDQHSGMILSQQLILDEPQECHFSLVIHQAANFQQFPEPALPENIVVRSADNRESLKFLWPAIDVPIKVGDVEVANEAMNGLIEQMAAEHRDVPSLLDASDGDISLVANFYEAADEFFRTRIWLTTPPDTIVKVSCPDVLPGDWFGVVMGQMGQELGVLFFDDIAAIQAVNESADPEAPGKGAQHLSGISFSLNEQYEVNPDEVAAAEQFGWPVASAEAWPRAFLIQNQNLAPVTASQLKFLPIAIKAVTDRLQNKLSDGAATLRLQDQTVSVTVEKLA